LTLYRKQLGATRTVSLSPLYYLTPSIVGVDSGYVVSWASVPNSSGVPRGIEVIAVRDTSRLNDTLDLSTVGRITVNTVVKSLIRRAGGIQDSLMSAPLDSLYQFPTMAYVPNFSSVPFEVGGDKWHICHIGWQQGAEDHSFILHRPIGVRFFSPRPTLSFGYPVENASQQLGTCTNEHPCITADSLRIAITFEAKYPWMNNGSGPRVIVLRFRDSVYSNGNYVQHRWSTPAYYYGKIGYDSKWPAVTEFPLMKRYLLRIPTSTSEGVSAEGGLVWTWQETMGTYPTHRFLYRYGWKEPIQLTDDGRFPTMTLAPYIMEPTAEPFSYTSIFYRGDDSTYFTRSRPFGLSGTGKYYPGVMENTPALSNLAFKTATTAGGRIFSYFQATRDTTPGTSWCQVPVLIGGIRFDREQMPIDAKNKVMRRDDAPGLPDAFFADPVDGETGVASFEEAMNVTRTSTFRAGSEPVSIGRVVFSPGHLLAWLATMPYDSTMGSPADIKVLTELVRASDDVVLWQDDTISARANSGIRLDETVEVPTDDYEGMDVYIRLRAVATAELDPVVTAGFGFDEDTSSTTFQKVIRPRSEGRALRGTAPAVIDVSVVPNPLTDRGELRLQLMLPGMMRTGIYDMLGRLVKELPAFDAPTPGEYKLELDLADLPKGVYTVHVEQGDYRASSRFTVVR
jgi:hypothetical protein